jgi:hypothetical protein
MAALVKGSSKKGHVKQLVDRVGGYVYDITSPACVVRSHSNGTA